MSRRRRRNEREPQRAGVLPAAAMPEKAVPRRLRVEGDLHRELMLAVGQLEDPRLEDVSVTRVQMTDDLQLARVYVRVGLTVGEGDGSDEARRRELMRGLRSAAGRLRRHVGQALSLRYTPELRFHYDEGFEAARRVDALLDEIHREGE